ncbi:MAG: copper transporter [Nocardioidaceae bacterium]
MIDFRYHIISIVAIFLALATGIALGAGPLKGSINQQLVDEADRDRQDKLELRYDLDQAELVAAFQDGFATEAAPELLATSLDGRTVAIISLPGADSAISRGLAAEVERAGGTVTGTVRIEPALLDPQNRQVAEGVATQVLDGVNGVPSTDDASSYQLVGYSLARGFLTTQPEGAPSDVAAQTIAASYRETDYLSVDESLDRRANLAVVVAGGPSRSQEPGQNELLTTLVEAMDAASGGVVVAGATPSAQDDGYLKAVRDSDATKDVSTVDVADTVAGQVVVVLALAEQGLGESGQYGGVNAVDGAVPDVVFPSR